MSPALVECVPNFSEGRRLEVVDRIVASAAVPGVHVLDRTSDASHNRSVITLVGAGDDLVEAAVRMARTAMELIDLREHTGEHPRMGATDVVPFVPVAGVTISGIAPAFAAITPRPQAIASSSTRPNVSWSPACTSASALARMRASSSDECRTGSSVTLRGSGSGSVPDAPARTRW